MQARASRIHGLSKEDFLKLTPKEWYEIEKDYLEEFSIQKEITDRQTARISLAIYKASPKFKRVSKTEDDFMPKKAKFGKPKNESANNLLAKSIWIHRRYTATQKHNENLKDGG